MSSSTAISAVKAPTELPLAVVLCLLVLGAGCSTISPGGSDGPPVTSGDFPCAPEDLSETAGQVDVYVTKGSDELDDAEPYESSPVSRIDAVDGAANAAIAQVGNESATDDVALSRVTRSLTGREVYAVHEALNESDSMSRPGPEYPGGAYFAYEDTYVVIGLAIYC